MSALLGHAPLARPTEPAELARRLYEKHGQRVFTFCYSRLRNREEAQDAAQTTFIYVLRSLQRGVEPEFELAWLLKIAFNVCRGTRRSTGRQGAVIQEVEDIDELAAPPSSGYEVNERRVALRDGLAHLPERQRRAILLREWQGLSYAEIADELGMSLGAVETLLFRARRNLASRLQHVRSGIGALNAASLAPFLRSVARGGLGKLALIGAGASVALIPVVATEIAPALADRKPDVTLRSAASADETTPGLAVTHPALKQSAPRTNANRARGAAKGSLRTQEPKPVTASGAADPGPVATSPTPGSQEPLAASSGVPSPSPVPSPQAPAPAAPIPAGVPGVQPPAALPTGDETLLNPLTDALAGIQAPVPLP